MSELLQRIEGEIQDHRLISRGQKILVAVSGGVDSMVLLHALHSLAPSFSWQIFVAHFNHQLRGQASDADEKFVRTTTKRLRLKYVCSRADVKVFAKTSKLSIEMAARKLRHDFLARTAKAERIKTIALAHHADDQVELFFLRLLRGAGVEGLAGMRHRSPSPANKSVSLVRPLLGFTKAELLNYAAVNKVAFREDATNASDDFLRNRIRNELLPLLQKKYSVRITKSVLRTMEILGAESDFMTHFTAGIRAGNPSNSFAKLPVAVQRRILRQELVAIHLMPEFELVEALRLSPGKFLSVNAEMAVTRAASGKIQLRLNPANEFVSSEMELKLTGRAGRGSFGGLNFAWRLIGQKTFSLPSPKAGTELFDADKIGDEIVLRHWRAGDRFQPIGMKSPVKLQDLFVNAKVPAPLRRRLVLATTTAGEIFWVEGLRIGERFKLTPLTWRQFKWDWTKNSG